MTDASWLMADAEATQRQKMQKMHLQPDRSISKRAVLLRTQPLFVSFRFAVQLVVHVALAELAAAYSRQTRRTNARACLELQLQLQRQDSNSNSNSNRQQTQPNPMKSSEVKWSEVVGLVVAELKGIGVVSSGHLIRFSCHEPNTAGIWSASDGIFFVAIGMF
jgi:hypothetical protein